MRIPALTRLVLLLAALVAAAAPATATADPFVRRAALTPSDATAGDLFGVSVAASRTCASGS